ncbi:MAG: N-acetylmuramoyl-L-alanine amidase [Candidatus Aminicenantes bacterium]|nr:N-acetylmuramoyl-L-alanine amidase [Candidatus Aminicenantes bacterium]
MNFPPALRSAGVSLLAFFLFAASGGNGGAAAPALVEVYALRHYTHPNFTRIVVDLGELREYTYGELHAPDRLFVDILQAQLNPILHGQSYALAAEYISQIRIAQRDRGIVRLVVDLDFGNVKSYRIYYLPDPFRIVMDIYPGRLPEAETKEPSPAEPKDEPRARPAEPSAGGYSLARQLGLGIRTIVIDPGHGGTDPGCVGRRGELEKELVLDVCLRLRKLLASVRDLEVVLTRETDIFIPLENRTVIANQKKADLFVSVHANSSLNPQRTGVETFYLNLSLDPAVDEIAARENATSTKSIGQMKDILAKIIRNSKIVESRDMADKVQHCLVASLSRSYADVRNLGVKGGPFWVLIGSNMPSILVEVSHLSNAKEAARLKEEAYRQKIAQGIYDGLVAYMQSLGKPPAMK